MDVGNLWFMEQIHYTHGNHISECQVEGTNLTFFSFVIKKGKCLPVPIQFGPAQTLCVDSGHLLNRAQLVWLRGSEIVTVQSGEYAE